MFDKEPVWQGEKLKRQSVPAYTAAYPAANINWSQPTGSVYTSAATVDWGQNG